MISREEYVKGTMNMIKKEPYASKLDLIEVQIAVQNKIASLDLNKKLLNTDIEHVCRITAFHVLLLFGIVFSGIYLVPISIVTTVLSVPIESIGKYIGSRLERVQRKRALDKNVIPVTVPPLSKDECMIAVNTHVRSYVNNVVGPSIAQNAVIPLIAGTLTGSMLAGVLIGLGFQIIYLGDQIFALDIFPIHKNQYIPDKDIDVLAYNDGIVLFSFDAFKDDMNVRNTDNIFAGFWSQVKPGGNSIIIRHESGMYTMYGHLKNRSIKVRVGDVVKAGQKIAKMGDTGNSGGMHLHFEAAYTIPLSGGIGQPLKNVAQFNGIDLTDMSELFFDTSQNHFGEIITTGKKSGTLKGKLPNFFSIN